MANCSKFVPAKLYLPNHTGPTTAPASSVRTLPELLEYNAKHNSAYVFCQQTRRSDESLQLLSITHGQLKEAVFRCQQWLRQTVKELAPPLTGEDGRLIKGPPVALFMESDVGLWVHILALLSLGTPILLLSARLSPTAVSHLLATTGARAMVVSPRLYSTAEEGALLLESGDLQPTLYERIPYEFFLQPDDAPAPSERSVCLPGYHSDETDRQVIILHSSGTTGLPRPIYQSHEYLLAFAAAHDFSSDEEAQNLNLSTLPLYHGFGLVGPCLSMSIGLSLCLPVTSISSGATIVETLELTKPHSLMTVPSVLEDITFLDNGLGIQALCALRFVAFGGGPLKQSIGEKLTASGVVLLNHYGATETGALAPIFAPALDSNYDYRYFRLRKDFNLQVVPVQSPPGAERQYKLVAHPFGWGAAFEVQDQLICNPNHPDSDFNAVGRNDDLIVLATGEKVVPTVLEVLLSESEHCKVAIAFGQNQLELGILIEPLQNLDPQHYDSFKDRIWPTVQYANERMDAHARISSRKAILIVPSGKSIPRTDKGSVMRKEVYKTFEEEISQAYRDLEDSMVDPSLAPLDIDQLEASIKKLIEDRLNWKVPSHQWTYDHDLFELGMDSLQALQLRRLLLALVHASKEGSSGLVPAGSIPRDFVYRNPSVSKLAASLRGKNSTDLEDAIGRFVDLYAIEPRDHGIATPNEGSTVLLTGSTGSLGIHLLYFLANTPAVARVICLNRPSINSDASHAEERVKKAVGAKEIYMSGEVWSKIQILETDTAAPRLGLPQHLYDNICRQVTHVIHNAWPMDFNRLLPSFETQFQALRNLLYLCRDAHACRPTVRPTFVSVSSIAVVGKYPQMHGARIAPEIPMSGNDCTDAFGYAQAKLVCERITERAARVCGGEFEARVVRVGQLTGAKMSGLWNVSEHFPALVKSSQLVGALPKLYGTLSWIPVDLAAQVMVELLFASGGAGQVVFHVENPIRQSWHDVLTVVASGLGIKETGFLPYGEWLSRVLAVSDERMDENPAKKLAGFFADGFERMSGGEIVMDTAKAREVSACLRGMSAVDADLIAAYLARWREAGYLS